VVARLRNEGEGRQGLRRFIEKDEGYHLEKSIIQSIKVYNNSKSLSGKIESYEGCGRHEWNEWLGRRRD
jgi:hypothetical protein